MQPNTASRWGLDDARGHEQPTVGRVALLWTVLGGGAERVECARREPRGPALAEAARRVRRAVRSCSAAGLGLALLRCRCATRRSSIRAPAAPWSPTTSALPPAFVAYGWRASPSRAASALRDGRGHGPGGADAPVIETAAKPPATSPGAATPARVVSHTDTEVRLDVEAKAAGHVVLLDTFYPGWHAEVDGREQPIRAADLAFRAVAVPPGRHTVRFFYRPTSVIAGGALSLAALLAIGVCLIGLRRRRRIRGARRRTSSETAGSTGSRSRTAPRHRRATPRASRSSRCA